LLIFNCFYFKFCKFLKGKEQCCFFVFVSGLELTMLDFDEHRMKISYFFNLVDVLMFT